MSCMFQQIAVLLLALIMLSGCADTPVALAPTAPAMVAATVAMPTAEPTPSQMSPSPIPLPVSTSAPSPTLTPQLSADPIGGGPALGRGAVQSRPFVVMIDNHPNAYPQAGMDSAALVFEALAEGGITRYMAVFVDGISPDRDMIGPVRSARDYFVRWAINFRGLYTHAGGSPTGLELAESSPAIVNADGLRADAEAAFWRDAAREAPHNLYTSSTRLREYLRQAAPGTFEDRELGFLFKPDAPADQRPPEQQIDYFFIYADDPAGWRYDPASNSYGRIRRGKPHIDAISREQLRFKNVLVIEVAEQAIAGDDQGRIEQQVIGEGRGVALLDGQAQPMRWRKANDRAALRFYTPAGAELALNPGPTWIAVLPRLDNLKIQ